MRAVDVRVTGLVQGVCFRARTQDMAHQLGVSGWVANTDDGAVQAHLEGPEDAVDALLAWCREGPPAARVHDVEVREAEPEGAHQFRIRY